MYILRPQVSISLEVLPVFVTRHCGDVLYSHPRLKHAGDRLMTQVMKMKVGNL